MITIHGVLRSRASRNIWLLEEMGTPYRHVPVIQAYRLPDPAAPDAPLNTRSPAFLALNPNGRIPAMEEDGLVLNESLAINLYLAKRHGGDLGPRDAAEDGEMTAWTLWAVTEAEPHAIQVLYNRVGNPTAPKDPARADAAVAALRAPFAVLDAALAKDGFVVGGRFTVADVNLAEVFRYAQPAPELFEAAPRVKDWLARVQARPAFRRMWALRDAEPA
ncbi:MAG: glutathione S-transferase family protein [Acetobacteraceae bacterium]|nr:glutathione S-transferase family protein [Acetobacteraceae bacterium]